MSIKKFLDIADDILTRYEHVKNSLDEAITRKEIALGISNQIDKSIMGVDMEKLQDSIDISALPSFDFDSEQMEKMVDDIFSEIMLDNITLDDYVSSQDEAISIMQDCCVGGIQEEYDPTKPETLEYHYEKNTEIARAFAINTLLNCQKLIIGDVPLELADRFDKNALMMSNFGVGYEIDGVMEHIDNVSSLITSYATLTSMGCNIDLTKFSELMSTSQAYIEMYGTKSEKDFMISRVNATMESIIAEAPELSNSLNTLRGLIIESESESKQDSGLEQ